MLLRELYENQSKTAVLAFGRMNPPTIGHKKLADKVASINGDHFIFLSQTQKPKTDPLDYDTKVKFAQQFFPNVTVGDRAVRTIIDAMKYLNAKGYTDIVYVAGSDRIPAFKELLNKYNNVEYEFNSIEIVSAGERDPDADGAEGMSASKMRSAASEGNIEAFTQGTPNPKLAQQMYDAVRKGMGITENSKNKLIKPRDPNAQTMQNLRKSGAMGAHKDKKKLNKQGYKKHKGRTDEKEDPNKPKEKGLKGFDPSSIRALMNLKAKFPNAPDELSALLKQVGDLSTNTKRISKLSKNADKTHDERLTDIEKDIDNILNQIRTFKKENVKEIMAFVGSRSPKRAKVKKKPEKFEPTVQDKVIARRKAAAKGDKNAWTSKFSKD